MTVTYYDAERGLVRELRTERVSVPFGQGLGPSLYFRRGGRVLDVPSGGSVEGVHCSMQLEITYDALLIRVELENRTERDFAPEALGLRLGLDLDNGFSPTLLRAEKTHFWGCFVSPLGAALAVSCREPIAAWELACDTADRERKTYTGNLLFLTSASLAEEREGFSRLGAGKRLVRTVRLTPLKGLEELPALLRSEGCPEILCDTL